MSHPLNPLSFPLHGTRLIEASAGTGKTWTIAALYVRLVLGHGGPQTGLGRPLQPAEILVMTFTRAATRELSDRIRERLVEAARFFRGTSAHDADPYLAALLDEYRGDPAAREQAAHRLALAAEAMDESAVFTIDAWCQRMLREHAFDSGALFDEELVESERALYGLALRDYWRSHVYALSGDQFDQVHGCWRDLGSFDKAVRDLVQRADLIAEAHAGKPLSAVLALAGQHILQQCPSRKVWAEHAAEMEGWFLQHRGRINGNTYRNATVDAFFAALREWAGSDVQVLPGDGFYRNDAWAKWDLERLLGALNADPDTPVPDGFAQVAVLKDQLDRLPKISQFVLAHAAATIAGRMGELKAAARKFGFADMLTRLKSALGGENGAALRSRILARYPVAMIDEFQDTSPDQYAIFDMLYKVAGNDADTGLFLIGDPKQAIYGFRGADIHSYLAARRATEGRHYWLARNFRSTAPLVEAVNQLFVHAEGQGEQPGHPKGAFGFRDGEDNALPFQPVEAKGRDERLVRSGAAVPAMTIWAGAADGYEKTDVMQGQFARACAEQIVTLLNDASAGFDSPQGMRRLAPADFAVLVKNRFEAAVIQRALHARAVPSVYLSDSDSVFQSDEAADVLRWLQAVANPLDATLVRCALATRTADVPLPELAALTTDDLAWEARVEQLKSLKLAWQRHGVLAMLRRFLHELHLPGRLLSKHGGERSLTNLLHLAELLQRESQHLDGEQGLVRWLGEQIESSAEAGEEHILRLESDAQLVKIVTIHKSKGLEYPLVFLPFAAASRLVTAAKRTYLEYMDHEAGRRKIDFSLSGEICAIADQARLEEDIRLLYVALTRARHAVWIGVADVDGSCQKSAFGYLAAGGMPLAAAELKATLERMAGGCEHVDVVDAPAVGAVTPLSRADSVPPLRPRQEFGGEFQRNWTVASYSSIAKTLGSVRAPATAAEQKMSEEVETGIAPGVAGSGAWHRFPRGALPGLFIHELLEWMMEDGLEHVDQPSYREQLRARCARGPSHGWQDEAADWMIQAAGTILPPVGTSLSGLQRARAETEFWLPTNRLQTAELDRLCQTRLLPGVGRPSLSERQLTGMLHGFIDLVFEHEGRYWILDYKTNALGDDDSAYHLAALQAAMADKRYEVQGVIYLLALHRMLKSRLGASYDPARQLGGALFLFLRGVGNPLTRGCCPLIPDLALLDELDRLLPNAQLEFAS
jgi:exodeoxyribonuclease V beta subunit